MRDLVNDDKATALRRPTQGWIANLLERRDVNAEPANARRCERSPERPRREAGCQDGAGHRKPGSDHAHGHQPEDPLRVEGEQYRTADGGRHEPAGNDEADVVPSAAGHIPDGHDAVETRISGRRRRVEVAIDGGRDVRRGGGSSGERDDGHGVAPKLPLPRALVDRPGPPLTAVFVLEVSESRGRRDRSEVPWSRGAWWSRGGRRWPGSG